MHQSRVVFPACLPGGTDLQLVADPLQIDELKQERKARHGGRDFGGTQGILFLEIEELQPLGLRFSQMEPDGAISAAVTG